MSEVPSISRTPYLRSIRTSFGQSVLMILRHKRVLLASGVTFVPVIIPVALAFLSTGLYADNGYEIFVQMVEQLYLKAMAPLLALFFGCMLIGEDIEAQTIPYILTRPVPRSGWVLGRFGAYLIISSAILLTSILLTFFACTALGGLTLDEQYLDLLLHYAAVSVVALVGYGSLCTFLGAMVKRPVVFGVVFLFGWQRMAGLVPGLVDFLTIEKYIMALLPPLAIEREVLVLRTVLFDFVKEELVISPTRAGVTLSVITLMFLFLTAYVVRTREYSSARAIGS